LGFPLFAKWYITSKCNLRCTHCYLTDYTEQAELEKILSIVDYLGKKGLHSICLLGGEPLVRNDLEIIVERIASHKMGIKIATNGILATAARSQALVNAGANNFQVSVEGHLAELNDSIRGEGTFSKILNGIAELTSAGAHVSLAITLNKKNHQYLGSVDVSHR
jgi:MoaA/NifB/PqqE/SkfB family radical SAM enzyme